MSRSQSSLEKAYAVCRRMARTHYENFPVASLLLPAPMRPHVAAVYAFARHADDLADEGHHPPATRHAALDEWIDRLRRTVNGAVDSPRDETDLVCVAAAATIRDRSLPVGLFEDLVSAFRQDVTVDRYRTWGELLDYCRRSANPVGRLVLRIAGPTHDALDRESDRVCTALQLTNFLQDVEVDWRRGRLYVPAEIYEAHGASPAELSAPRLPPAWTGALGEMADRTRLLFEEGRGVCDGVRGRLRVELRATWLGGRRILDRLEANGYDPRAGRPTLGWSDVVPIAWKAAVWPLRP